MLISNINLNYIDYGNKNSDAIILLHGWGQNIEMMKKLGDGLSDNYRIVIVDLPGFGQSSEPSHAWTVDEYADMVHELVAKLKLKNITIIGHSFGGKIGLLYASKYDVKKLVCLASPFKKEIKKESLKVKMLKFAKKIPLLNKTEEFFKKRIGSTDYKNASKIMRDILVLHVNYDITEQLYKIKAPTLLIWGTLDKEVDIKRAHELEQVINNCGLVEYEGCTHYAYLERLGQTINVLRSFLGGN